MRVNLSNIGFKANQNQQRQFQAQNINNTQPKQQIQQHLENADSFERKKPPMTEEEMRAKIQKSASINRAVGAISAIAVVAMIHGLTPIRTQSYGNTVSEVANYVDMPSEILAEMNDVSVHDVLPSVRLPKKFNRTEEEIKKIEEKLEKNNLSDRKRENLNEELMILKERKALQDKMGVAYYDDLDSRAYIQLNDSYLASDVEYAWGISEGTIEKHNDLIYRWTQSKTEEGVYETNSSKKYAFGLVEIPLNQLDINDSKHLLRAEE